MGKFLALTSQKKMCIGNVPKRNPGICPDSGGDGSLSFKKYFGGKRNQSCRRRTEMAANSPSERLSSLQGSFEGYSVGVFEVSAHRYSVGDTGYSYRLVFEYLEKIMSGCLAFAAWVGRNNDFIDVFGPEAGE